MTIPELLLRVGVWAVDWLRLGEHCYLLNLGRVCVMAQR